MTLRIGDGNTAMQEAAFAASNGGLIYHCISLFHPSFVLEDGSPTAIRVVWGEEAITARTPTDDIANPDALVDFEPMYFKFTDFKIGEEGAEAHIALQGTSSKIQSQVAAAQQAGQTIEMVASQYLPASLETGPDVVYPTPLWINEVSSTINETRAKAVAYKLQDMLFPADTYNIENSSGLYQ